MMEALNDERPKLRAKRMEKQAKAVDSRLGSSEGKADTFCSRGHNSLRSGNLRLRGSPTRTVRCTCPYFSSSTLASVQLSRVKSLQDE